MVLARVTATRFLNAMTEGGSLPVLVKADDGKSYVVKLRGAGQGVSPLLSEIVVGEIARVLGLKVPGIVLVEITPDFKDGEQEDELRRLLKWSTGINVGLEFVSGAAMFDPAACESVDGVVASRILWLDMFVLNIDRTVRNPNVLQVADELCVIDHGAALYFHFNWESFEKSIRLSLPRLEHHVLLPWADELEAADLYAHSILTSEIFERIIAAVPDELFLTKEGSPAIEEQRRLYVRFLAERLESSVDFSQEVQRVREDAV